MVWSFVRRHKGAARAISTLFAFRFYFNGARIDISIDLHLGVRSFDVDHSLFSLASGTGKCHNGYRDEQCTSKAWIAHGIASLD
jgi:hypothetical protein